MASHRIETYCRKLAFPIGALILSKASIASSARAVLIRFRTSAATSVATGVT